MWLQSWEAMESERPRWHQSEMSQELPLFSRDLSSRGTPRAGGRPHQEGGNIELYQMESLVIPEFALFQPNKRKVTLYVQLAKLFRLGLQHRWDCRQCPEDLSFLFKTSALCHRSWTIPSLSGIEQSRRGFFFFFKKTYGQVPDIGMEIRKVYHLPGISVG